MTKRITLALLLLVAFAGFHRAQTSGTITVAQTITALAGAVTCTFTTPAKPAIHIVCGGSGGNWSQDAQPAVGPGGITGSYTLGSGSLPDSVLYQLTQPSAGVLNWSITANGTIKTGVF